MGGWEDEFTGLERRFHQSWFCPWFCSWFCSWFCPWFCSWFCPWFCSWFCNLCNHPSSTTPHHPQPSDPPSIIHTSSPEGRKSGDAIHIGLFPRPHRLTFSSSSSSSSLACSPLCSCCSKDRVGRLESTPQRISSRERRCRWQRRCR